MSRGKRVFVLVSWSLEECGLVCRQVAKVKFAFARRGTATTRLQMPAAENGQRQDHGG